jgi:hypothetical protein
MIPASVERVVAGESSACMPLPEPPAAPTPPKKHLPPPASGLQPPASSLQPPASSLQPPASSLQPPASSLQPPACSLRPPACRLPPVDLVASWRSAYTPVFPSRIKPSAGELRRRCGSGDPAGYTDSLISNGSSAGRNGIQVYLMHLSRRWGGNSTDVASLPHEVAESQQAGSVRNDTPRSFDKACTGAHSIG